MTCLRTPQSTSANTLFKWPSERTARSSVPHSTLGNLDHVHTERFGVADRSAAFRLQKREN